MSETRRKPRTKQKRKEFKGIDLEFVKKKLASLQQGNRLREAIVYAFYNYLQEVQGYYNIPRRTSQTAREYAMDLAKKIKLPPTEIYTFATLFEEARFGQHPIDANKYSEALQLFLKLHDLMMGGTKQVGQEPPAPAAE